MSALTLSSVLVLLALQYTDVHCSTDGMFCKKRSHLSLFDMHLLSDWQTVFEAGKTYMFLANNGMYVSRIRRGSVDYVEATKTQFDYFCRFVASEIGDGKVAFRSDSGNFNYISRINRGGQDNIEAAKTAIDIYSEFTVEVDEDGPWPHARFVYLRADNEKYIGVIQRGIQRNVEAVYDNRDDPNTRFVVLEAK